ncbi:nucleotidyltransferase family protein [Flavisphingomonas formosensis]|uniref:nucleotidyltransferase family protein n=1 Tax=Flavisphingomonas formosensis TaxID=861534 RepID=UPI0018DF8C42|nr:nucleotidyltransferase family protein [Sphingomonas formosensis]
MRLLLAACLRPLFGGEAPAAISHPDFDWEALIRHSGDHLTTPALACALRGQAGLPDEVRAYFEALLALNGERNAQIRAAMPGLAAAINGCGATPLLLKGAAMLMGGIHADPAARVLGDIDLLVPATWIEACVAATAAIGYAPVPGHATAHHATPQLNRETGCEIELHHQPVMIHLRALLGAEEMADGARSIDCGGAIAAVPSATHLALHAIVHSELGDQNGPLARLSFRTLLDLAALARQPVPPDWQAIGERLERHGHGSIWSGIRAQLHSLLGVSIGEGPVPALPDRYRLAVVDARHRLAARIRFRAARRYHRFLAEPATMLEVLRPGWWRRRWSDLRSLANR